jgi:hypothetical protein
MQMDDVWFNFFNFFIKSSVADLELKQWLSKILVSNPCW